MSAAYDYARFYTELGFRIFRVNWLERNANGRWECSCGRGAQCSNPGKHPQFKGWQQDASSDPSAAYPWKRYSQIHIGIATGKASGLVVVDIDPRHGGDKTLAELEREYGCLPDPWRNITGSGGSHILFRHPGGFVPNSANRIGPGIDVRGDGGFIVAPPSRHISGGRYQFDPEYHPDDVDPAPLPGWLADKMRRQPRQRYEKPAIASSGLSRYGEVALDNACKAILDASEGKQEYELNRQPYGIGRLAAAGALPVQFALSALLHVAKGIADFDLARPWRREELATKVERAFHDGMRNPRRVR